MTIILKLSILIVLISFHVYDGHAEGNPPRKPSPREGARTKLVEHTEKLIAHGKQFAKDGRKVIDKGIDRVRNNGGASPKIEETKKKKEPSYEYESGSESESERSKHKGASSKKARHDDDYESYSGSSASRSRHSRSSSNKEKHSERSRSSSGEGSSGENAHSLKLNQWPIAKIGIPVDVQCPHCHENFKYPLQFVLLPPKLTEVHTPVKSRESPSVLLKKLGHRIANTVTGGKPKTAEPKKDTGKHKAASDLPKLPSLPVPAVPPKNLDPIKTSEKPTKGAGPNPAELLKKAKIDPDKGKAALQQLGAVLKVPQMLDSLKKTTSKTKVTADETAQAKDGKTKNGEELKDKGGEQVKSAKKGEDAGETVGGKSKKAKKKEETHEEGQGADK